MCNLKKKALIHEYILNFMCLYVCLKINFNNFTFLNNLLKKNKNLPI